MEMGIANVSRGKEEVAAADHPQLRLFTVPKHIAYRPQDGFRDQPPGGEQAKWLVCTPKNVSSATGAGSGPPGTSSARPAAAPERPDRPDPHVVGRHRRRGVDQRRGPGANADFREAVQNLKEPAKEPGTLAEQMQRWYARHDPGSAEGLGWADPALNDATGRR